MFRVKTRIAQLLVAVMVVVLMIPATAVAITMREGDSVIVESDETISDDLYAFGNTITISGTVEGDVIAFGQIVDIGGIVRGSVITAAQSVRIDGRVDGTVRAAGSLVDVGGRVGGDVLAAANQVAVSADVARDVATGAQSATIDGRVGRNLMAGAESLTIAGPVGGDVQAQASSVTVASGGSIAGDLDYWSDVEADVQGGVSGSTSRHQPKTDRGRSADGGVAHAVLGAVLAWVQSFMGFALLGLLLAFVARGHLRNGSQTVADRPMPSVGIGLAVFFSAPVAAGLVFFVGLFVGAWWLAFVLLAVYWLLLVAGVIVGSLAVGRTILRMIASAGEPALAWSFLLGLTLVWLVAAIPLVGWLVAWTVMLAGAGSLVLLCAGKGQRPIVATADMEAVAPVPVAEPPTS